MRSLIEIYLFFFLNRNEISLILPQVNRMEMSSICNKKRNAQVVIGFKDTFKVFIIRIEFLVFVCDFYHFLNSLDKYPRFNKIVNHHIESHWQTWSTCDYFIECELVLRSMSSRYHIAQHHRSNVSVNLTEEILLSETYHWNSNWSKQIYLLPD